VSAEHAAGRPADIHAHRVLILDFGSQYTQLIARRVRELGVYCEIHPWDAGDADVRAFAPRAIILSGGPESVTQPGAPAAPEAVWALGVPVLGICYGMQTMAAQLGGRVEPGAVHEFGYAEVRARGHSALLRDIEDRVNAEGHGLLDVWMSHGDRVTELPPGFKSIASTPDVPIAGMADEARRYYALQFHPEVTHTKPGHAHLRALPARHLRLRLQLERRQHHRRCGRARARPGRPAARCCWDSRAASTRRWSRRCCTRRSAIS
jgi:GMP synthase (glutamine-hydrolysing)